MFDFPSQIPFLENSRSWVIAQDALDQSYCRIRESPIPQEWVEVWNGGFACK